MTKKHSTKRALLTSAISLLLCFAMLTGTTFAWFTDSVTSSNNIITTGNLDVELKYAKINNGAITEWDTVQSKDNIFDKNALWEPGAVEVVYLEVSNLGSLALKYQLGVNVVSEIVGKNVAGEEFKLSDHLVFKVVDLDAKPSAAYTREEAMNEAGIEKGFKDYNGLTTPLEVGGTDYVALIVYMPETVGNEANYRGDSVPTINLGINLFATQQTAEEDSFGDDYDEDAPALLVNNTEELQAALDNASLGTAIRLAPGVAYGAIEIRPTANNGTVMYCSTHDFTTTDAEEFKLHLGTRDYHASPKYTTSLNGVTIIGAEGATVGGFVASSGHSYGDVYDYVRGIDYNTGSAYYNTLYIDNLTFKNVTFNGKIDINTSDADSVYEGVTFDGCSFTTGGTASSNGAAIRYYNEANNGKVKNIVVKNSTFNNCYQGVYVHNVNGITVTDSIFDTTGHNAIGIQGSEVDLKDVVIVGNTFKGIGDRIVRFDKVAADSSITIQNNVAADSGDEAGEVIKATDIAQGATISVKNNSWGEGRVVVNSELKDQNDGAAVIKVSNEAALNIAINNGAANIEVANGSYTVSSNVNAAIVGSGKDTKINFTNSIENVNISNATITGEPRLAVKSGQSAVFNNVNFEGTKAWGSVHGEADFKDCTFENLLHIDSSAADTTITFENCTFGEYSIIKLGGSAKYILKNCEVKKLASDASGAWGKEWLITYCNTTFEGCKLGRVIRAGKSIDIFLNDCVDGAGVAVTADIVHKNASPSVHINGYEFITSANVSKDVAPLEQDFLFPAGTNAVMYNNVNLSGDAQIVHTENAVLGLSNVVADLDHDVIVRKSAGAICIENSSFTLTDGAKLISVGEGGDGYQVFLINVKVNGVLLTDANAGQYLEGISWFQAIPEWPNMA